MPFDDDQFNAPATNGQVAGVAIYTSLALNRIVIALEKIRAGLDPSDEIKLITETADKLDQKFDELSGYTKE